MCLYAFRIDDATLHRALDLAHHALIEADTLGTAIRIDDANCVLDILGNRTGGTNIFASTAIDAVVCYEATHAQNIESIAKSVKHMTRITI